MCRLPARIAEVFLHFALSKVRNVIHLTTATRCCANSLSRRSRFGGSGTRLMIRGDRRQLRSRYSGAVRGGPRLQLLFEPGACELRDLLQRSRLLKEMRGSRHDLQLLLASELGIC